jgi:hypothetical protein
MLASDFHISYILLETIYFYLLFCMDVYFVLMFRNGMMIILGLNREELKKLEKIAWGAS